jgi:hypothetical protein
MWPTEALRLNVDANVLAARTMEAMMLEKRDFI